MCISSYFLFRLFFFSLIIIPPAFTPVPWLWEDDPGAATGTVSGLRGSWIDARGARQDTNVRAQFDAHHPQLRLREKIAERHNPERHGFRQFVGALASPAGCRPP